MPPVLVPLLLLMATATLFYILSMRRRTNRLNPPPGPPKDPFIGHLRIMPKTQSGLAFHSWAKIYGDVMQLEVLGQRIVILDTHQAATDLLDKRSSIYSDRPAFPLYDILGASNTSQSPEVYRVYSNSNGGSATTCPDLLGSAPENYIKLMSRFSTSIVVRIATGHQVVSQDDPYLHLSKMVYEAFSRTGRPGGSALDLFPVLRYFPSWFPGAYYAGVARAWKPTVRKLYDYPFDCVQMERETGTAVPSFLLSRLEELDSGTSIIDEEEIKGVVATFFSAGEATTWSVVTLFVLAMVLHPECQKRAQEELDAVVGAARLPHFGDRGSLPYIECILQETLRWHPATPLGIPHRSTQDDFYRGMHIAKGTLVFPNIQAMSLDERVYKDATSFRPERFLPPPLGPAEPPFNCGFGFGRRVCVGLHLADNSLWIAIATILATCTISHALDSDGNEIIPKVEMSDGLASHPNDFACEITARRPAVEGLLEEATQGVEF
ncbi:cytochrome P450 [Mycena metata]|uniref:Cytochrome P450 n=1 Tax=Mycena metata TaxID=1033252 RepID=A0AAD7H709_9AGAR|nr:cytochrome P450 [Mycena metata]